MSRKDRLQAFMKEKKKDKKSKLKLGKLSEFNVSGLESMMPTLHLPIDSISSGIPKGVIYEIYGDESAGKSTTLGKIFENWKIGLPEEEFPSILYCDVEGTFNYKFFKRFRFLDEDDVLFYKESTIENIWTTIEDMVAADALDVIVIDSLSALQTNAEEDKTIDQFTMASMPKQINKMIKKFYQLAEDSGLTIIIVNSSYTDVGMSYGPPKQIIRGGKALALGKSCSVKITKSFSKSNAVIKKINGEDVMTEVYTKYTAEKNKIGVPKKEAITYLNVDPSNPKTFIYSKDVMAYATQFGFIEKGGAWLTAIDGAGEVIYKCQGAAKMADYIEINPSFYIKLKLLCYSKIYQPFEFYFHFDRLKGMLHREFEHIQMALTEDLSFQDGLSEEDEAFFQNIIDQESDILDLSINDIYTAKQVAKAQFELEKFYGDDIMDNLKEVNKVKEIMKIVETEITEEN